VASPQPHETTPLNLEVGSIFLKATIKYRWKIRARARARRNVMRFSALRRQASYGGKLESSLGRPCFKYFRCDAVNRDGTSKSGQLTLIDIRDIRCSERGISGFRNSRGEVEAGELNSTLK
jgi:hypothetical protein